MGLTVKTLKTKDADRGIVALNAATLEATGYSNGEYVAVHGPDGRTFARVWEGYANDDEGIIRMDDQLRQRVGAAVDDEIEIEATDVVPADEITVTVDDVDVPGTPRNAVRRELTNWAVAPGREVQFSASSGPLGSVSDDKIVVSVEETTPDGTVVVTADTEIELRGFDERTGDAARTTTGGPERTAASPDVTRVSETPSDEDDSDGNVPDTTFEDVGGLADGIESVQELVELPLDRPELFERLGIERPNGVLLYGPPGTGKTLLARAAANEIDAHFASIAAPEIVSEYYGRSEERLREVFEEAEENSPGIVFVDEIDAIARSRDEATDGVESRIVAQLLSLMDGIEDRSDVIVVATTNRVDDLDAALRRGGRFDHEIEIAVPDGDARKEILDIHTGDMPLGDAVDVDDIAGETHGFVGADLALLAQSAGMHALRRVRDADPGESTPVEDWSFPDDATVTAADFDSVIDDVDPAGMRELSVSVPDTSWEDVGGLADVERRMKEAVQWPLEYSDAFEELDLASGAGVLLYGPPGTGKTLLARAVASEAESNFISIRGPEILDRFVGESEAAVRRVFERARENSPAVVFFDEFDALAGERAGGSTDGGVGERVVSQLLTEIDGLEPDSEVAVVATSNRPDLLDPALLRSGRFEQKVRVPAPDESARREILEVHTRNRTLADEVDLDDLAERAENYVGADLEFVCRTATFSALRDAVTADADDVDPSSIVVGPDHFEQAMDEVSPSVTAEMSERYDELQANLDANDDDPKGFH